jgi:hypothetical protein
MNLKKPCLIVFFMLLILPFSTAAFSQKKIPLPRILAPELVRVDETQVYITEGANVNIYSKKDFSLVKRFGKRGEGPREFLIGGGTFGWLWIVIRPDSIFIHSMGKISYYSKKGVFMKERKIPIAYTPALQPLEDRFVGNGFLTENNRKYWTTNIYDAQLKIKKEMYRYERAFYEGRSIDPYGLKTPDFYIYGNKIFIADTVETGAVYVFDKNGNKLYTITPEYERIKITEKDKESARYHYNIGTHKNLYNRYKNKFEFPQYFPAMRFMIVDHGKIYLMTYKKKDGATQFLILDVKGKLLKKVFLPVKDLDVQYRCPFDIDDGKLYHFVELEEEGTELHITEID